MDESFHMPDTDRIQTVSQLTRSIRYTLESSIGDVWVEGEISNLRVQSSGHQYFTLKDAGAQLSCVLFKGSAARLSTPLRDGQQIQVFGGITVYEQRGSYQMVVRTVQPKGLGSLQAQFEALKQRLAQEGWFDAEHKKSIPKFPQTIALVTSPTGAAIRDMLQILTRRAPWLRVLVYPVKVQGEGAAAEIAEAIKRLNLAHEEGAIQVDTIIIGRGGGSLEDLWAFNEEILAKQIFLSELPIISAVGHEIDFTISDFVADLRAPTPSAAAELVAPDYQQMMERLEGMERNMKRRVENVLQHQDKVLSLLEKGHLVTEPLRYLERRSQWVDELESNLEQGVKAYFEIYQSKLLQYERVLQKHNPALIIQNAQHRIELAQHRLERSCQQHLEEKRQRLLAMKKLLQSLGPKSVLSRGFSMSVNQEGKVVEDASTLKEGDLLMTQFAKGQVQSRVIKPPSEA